MTSLCHYSDFLSSLPSRVLPFSSVESHSQPVKSDQSNVICYDHPNHVVVVNTQPVFGSSLTSLIEENSDSEMASATEDISSKSFHPRYD